MTPGEYERLKLVTPEFENPLLPGLALALVGDATEYHQIPAAPAGPMGMCYWNVEAAVAEAGGSRVDGWLIQWLPGRLVVALHHAVWLHPEKGHWVDPTAKSSADPRQDWSVFVPDASRTVVLDPPSKIRPRFFRLDPADQALAALTSSWGASIDLERELLRRAYSRGGSFAEVQKKGLEAFLGPEDAALLAELQRAKFDQREAIRKVNGDQTVG